MSEPLDLAAHFDALSDEERAALARALAADPALGDALARWRAVRAAVARDLAAALPAPDGTGPDRELIALLALAGAPLPADDGAPAVAEADDLLGAPDRARLVAARPAIEAALARHPGLLAAARRARADRDAFERAWAEHAEPAASSSGGSVPVAPRRAADRPAARRAVVTPLWSRVGRLAAVFALVTIGALAAYLFRRDAGLERVRVAEATTLDLQDGSTVELAAGSELLVPEGAPLDPEAVSGQMPEDPPRFARLVAGRALFRVAHTGEPFVVETPAATVTVLGTTFGVTATDRTTDVVLVNGVVEVATKGEGGEAVRLAPGQASRVAAGQAPTAAAPADLDAALAWTGDLFFADAEPLGRVAARLAAASGVAVEVDPALAGEVVSVTRLARTGDVEPTLRALARALDARVEAAPGGGFRLVPGAPAAGD